jgi:outer membrane biosynthesis protein TonB
MRKEIVAALVLSPMMLHAQASSPAQPMSSSSAPVNESRLVQPKILGALTGSDHSATGNTIRVTTGVTPPKLIHQAKITDDGLAQWDAPGLERKAVISLVVNEKGIPSDLKVVRSVGPVLDHNILEAVKKYRYEPGSLNHQPTAVPVNLEIVIRSSSI